MRRITTALLTALIATAAGGSALAQPHTGNSHTCINAAGHARGWCKKSNSRTNRVVISGTVLAVNGDLVQFREDNGTTISVDQHSLIAAGQPLTVGGHFALHGYFSNDIFVARPGGGNPGNPNGYPAPGSTVSVNGVITSISGNRVTIMQGLFSTVTIDDQQALNNGTAQNLYVGRSVTAYGYWNGGTFYATSIG